MHFHGFYKITVGCNSTLWSIQALARGPVKHTLVEVQPREKHSPLQTASYYAVCTPWQSQHCGLLPALSARQPWDQIQSQARKQAYCKFQQRPICHLQIIPLFSPNFQTWHDIVCSPAWGMQSPSPYTKSGALSLPRTHVLEGRTNTSLHRVIYPLSFREGLRCMDTGDSCCLPFHILKCGSFPWKASLEKNHEN